MYKIGDKFNISVRLDDSTIYDQDLIISYAFANIIITCGHCLPSNAIIPNGKILYTSGFDTPTENEEIGIMQLDHNINIKPQYKLTKTIELNELINSNMIFNKQLSMIHQSNSFNLNLIKIFDYETFNQLKFNQLNMINSDIQDLSQYYLIHSINKILSESDNVFNIFNISKVGIAYSEDKIKPLFNSDLKLIQQIAKKNNWILETDIIYYVSEPSYSGSPCTLTGLKPENESKELVSCTLTGLKPENESKEPGNNSLIKANNTDYFMGYHLGSTLGFKLELNKIVKIYKFIYFKFLSINQ